MNNNYPSKKINLLVLLLIIGALLFFGLDLFLGSVKIPFNHIISILLGDASEKESWKVIILNARLPKAIAAMLCGATLSVCGLQMQTLFRNPLAGPYILGISSGAGLGVAIFIMGLGFLGISNIGLPANSGIIIASILGSLGVLTILLSIINRLKDIMTVLILGIMIGSVITAIIGIIQYFSQDAQLKSFILWTMGDLSSVTNSELTLLTPIVIIGLVFSFLSSKTLNAYLLGETYARSLGVNIKQSQFIIILVTSV